MTFARIRTVLLHLLWCVLLAVSATAVRAGDADDTLHVYVQRGCPHCAEAKRFLDEVQSSARPGLRIVYHDVIADQAARDELIALSQQAGIWPPGVPTFVLGGRVISGFEGGPALLAFIADTGRAPPSATLHLPLIGELDVARLGLPAFTLALGLLDGFNPCAMWVLLFLLSLLVRLQDRRRMTLIAGTFVLVSGAVYFAFRRGLSLSIPESAKPGLYARMRRVVQAPSLPVSLLSVAALAVLVNLIELLCTAGLPAL